jgi:hypothetical protein
MTAIYPELEKKLNFFRGYGKHQPYDLDRWEFTPYFLTSLSGSR